MSSSKSSTSRSCGNSSSCCFWAPGEGRWRSRKWGTPSCFVGVLDTARDCGEQGKSRGLPKREEVWKDGDLGCPKALRSRERLLNRTRMGQGRWLGVRKQLGPPRGGPTWQSIMVSSSFNSIFFSPVSAHSSASRTGPSGRPPSFFRGASQSGDKARVGSNGEVVPGGVLKQPSSGNQALCFGKEAFPHSTSNKTQRCNHTY